MPTYTAGTTYFPYINTSGGHALANPGEQFTTYHYYSDASLTKDSDAPIASVSTNYTLTAAGAEDETQAIGSGVKKVRVLVNTAGITVKVYLQTKTDNDPLPPVGGLTSAYGIWEFSIDGRADTLIFEFSGAGNLTLEVLL